MMIEALEQRATKPWLVIATPSAQRELMRHPSPSKKQRTYLSIQDLFAKVFFAFHPGALQAAVRKLNTTPQIAASYLRWLPWLKEEVEDPLVKQLLELKTYLTELKLIKTTPQLETFLGRYDVVFYGDLDDPLIPRLTPYLKPYTNVYSLPYKQTLKQVTLTTFDTLDEELYAMLTELRRTHDKGIALDDMVIYAPSTHHRTRLLLEAPTFGLPLHYTQQAPLISYPQIQQFYECFLAHDHDVLYERLNHALTRVFDPLKPQSTPLYKRLLNVLHHYILETMDTVDGVLLKYYLEKETFATSSQGGVRVLDDLTHIANEKTRLFVIGAHDQALVALQSDRDLLPESVKEALHYPSLWEQNLAAQETVKQWLYTFPYVNLSWARKSALERYEESPLFALLKTEFPQHLTIPKRPLDQPFSQTLDRLESKIAYETYQAYGTQDQTLILAEAFQESLAVYDSQFTGLKESTLAKLLPKPLTLSYTALNTFFHCHFAYFCERVLKLTPYERSFAMSMGTLIHHLLEHHIHEPMLTEAHFEAALATLEVIADWQASDYHAANRQFAWMQKVFSTIQAQHAQTLMHLSETEKQLTYPLPDHPDVIFKGVVDKLMRQTLQGQDLYVIVDYKTGKPQLDPVRAVLGLNAQLIYYAYVLSNIDDTIQSVGFYEQALIPSQKFKYENKSFEQQFTEYLRWQGYSTQDREVLSLIDPDYASSSLIKGLGLTREGNFYAYSKVFDSSMLDQAFTRVKAQLSYAVNTIQQGTFEINPYADANGALLMCDHCNVKDLCYKKPHHYRSIPERATIFDSEDTL